MSSFCSQVQKNKETLEWSPHAQVRYSVEIVTFPCKLIELPSLQHDSNTESANTCLPQAVQSPMIECKILWHSTCALLLRNTNNQVFSLHGIDGARIQVIDERLQRQAVSEFAADAHQLKHSIYRIRVGRWRLPDSYLARVKLHW